MKGEPPFGPAAQERTMFAMLAPKTSSRWILGLVVLVLLLTGVAEALARVATKAPNVPLTPEEILARVPEEPDVLINVSAYDIPSTADLVKLGSRATPALVNCLANNLDGYAREICAHVLVATRDIRAIEPLTAALDDPNDTVRMFALGALGEIESRTATPRILKLMDEPFLPSWVRSGAIEALGRSGDPDAVEPLLNRFRGEWDGTAQEALWEMRRQLTPAQLNELVLPALQRWEKAGSEVREFAVERAGDLKLVDAVEPLMDDYAIAGSEARNRIVYNLGRIGDARAIPFVENLVDTSGEARLLNNVMFALQRLGTDVAPELRIALADKRAYIRYNAAFVAGDLKETRLVRELEVALEDINDVVRSEAAVALGAIGDKTAIPALEKATRDPQNNVRRDAFASLLQLNYAAYRDQAVAALAEPDNNDLLPSLVQALTKGEPETVSAVLQNLDPGHYYERTLGLQFLDAFQTMDNPDALAFLVRAADGWDHEAFKLLARFADTRTTFILESWVSHPGREDEQILRGLARLGARDRADVVREIFKRDGDISQLYAAFYFAALGEKEGMTVLLTALEVAPLEFKRTVATILTELDYTAFAGASETLSALMTHRDVYVRLYAARPLAHRGLAEGNDLLRAELDKKIPFISDEVLTIVGKLPAKEREALLNDWLKDADPMLKLQLQAMQQQKVQ